MSTHAKKVLRWALTVWLALLAVSIGIAFVYHGQALLSIFSFSFHRCNEILDRHNILLPSLHHHEGYLDIFGTALWELGVLTGLFDLWLRPSPWKGQSIANLRASRFIVLFLVAAGAIFFNVALSGAAQYSDLCKELLSRAAP